MNEMDDLISALKNTINYNSSFIKGVDNEVIDNNKIMSNNKSYYKNEGSKGEINKNKSNKSNNFNYDEASVISVRIENDNKNTKNKYSISNNNNAYINDSLMAKSNIFEINKSINDSELVNISPLKKNLSNNSSRKLFDNEYNK